MPEPTATTYEYLLTHYGPLLTLKHVAEIMHTTPAGVRMAITRRRQPFAVALSAARRRLGRRVYFEASRVAAVIDQDERSVETERANSTFAKSASEQLNANQSTAIRPS